MTAKISKKIIIIIISGTLQIWPLYSCNNSPVDLTWRRAKFRKVWSCTLTISKVDFGKTFTGPKAVK